MPKGTTWNEERDLALKNYRAEGLSFTDCAARINGRFGTTYSRNAVIGRAMRLGITESKVQGAIRRAKATSRREEYKRQQERDPLFVPPDLSKRRRRRYRVVPTPDAANVPKVEPNHLMNGSIASRVVHAIKKGQREFGGAQKPDTRALRCDAVPDPKHLSILDLTAESCRWPLGGWPSDTPVTFCGHWCPKDVPYCDAHEALSLRRVADAPKLDQAA